MNWCEAVSEQRRFVNLQFHALQEACCWESFSLFKNKILTVESILSTIFADVQPEKTRRLTVNAGTGNEQELEWNTVCLFFQKEVMVSDCVLNTVCCMMLLG